MPKLLLVDDSKTIQKVVSLILKGTTYSLFSAENGPEGEKLALIQSPDIILIDSLDLIQTFKKNPELQSIKLGLLHGNFKKISPELIKELKIDGTLEKPFDAQEFLKFLEDLMNVPKKIEIPLPLGVDILTDEFKSLFEEEELEKCLDFLEKPAPSTLEKTSRIPPIPPFETIPRETIEKICKEVIPTLAEQIIREEIQKLLNDKNE